jgi:predicted Zn finger-like uncharacterized protein
VSLATRCTACGTVFRVVQDQLKASEGWVRCGRCSEVFNALEGLFDLEGASGPVPLERESVSSAPAPTPHDEAPAVGVDVPAETPMRSTPAEAEAGDSATSTLIDTQADTRIEPHFDPSRAGDGDDFSRSAIELVDSQVSEEAIAAESAQPLVKPGFLRQADRNARWQRPAVQRALAALGGVLTLALALQVSMHHRDTMAQRWPAIQPALSALCGMIGCELAAPRSLAALAVDSSGVTRLEGAPLYRLQIALRNRSAWPVAMPALDLTLTNLRGEVVARRVLRATDVVPNAPTQIAAGADWSAQAVLDLGERRIAGYTVELFYP